MLWRIFVVGTNIWQKIHHVLKNKLTKNFSSVKRKSSFVTDSQLNSAFYILMLRLTLTFYFASWTVLQVFKRRLFQSSQGLRSNFNIQSMLDRNDQFRCLKISVLFGKFLNFDLLNKCKCHLDFFDNKSEWKNRTQISQIPIISRSFYQPRKT